MIVDVDIWHASSLDPALSGSVCSQCQSSNHRMKVVAVLAMDTGYNVLVFRSMDTGYNVLVFRLTPPSRPNNVCLKCLSARPSVRPQKVSSISVKFGM